ncbi:alpha/beta fold hydrolase [Dactylosporangium siamense]|uniref:Alpha/beta hydrolase n=1 Tax=Dactylosporangium siamense TaxID=685454 RepID=A0A919PFT6_9ACTN|nr:alpha/beta hydrolase [Dactylosporangium siamense]
MRVDGIDTHVLTAGPADAPAVVLLHGGAHGEAAETAWAHNIGALAGRHRVIAPDWLGFGRSAKLVDFADRTGRMLQHLARLLEELGVRRADVVGLSMGGAVLLRDLTAATPVLPVRRAVLTSAGGPPLGAAVRQRLMAYDGTLDGMREQVRMVFADPRFADDDAYVGALHEMSAQPGAFEAFASLALRRPDAPPPPAGDPTPYERITVPVLVVAGAQDRLKEPGFAAAVATRIPDARLEVVDGCGHCPQIEAAERWNRLVLDFLAEG